MDPDPYLVATNLSGITFFPVTSEVGVCIIIVLLLLIVAALVSGSETAFFALSADEIKSFKEQKSLKNQRVISLLQSPEKLLATVFVVNIFVAVTIVILSVFILGSTVHVNISTIWSYVVQTVFIACMLLIFGEVIPKVYASQNAAKVSRLTAGTLCALQKIFYPFVILSISSNSLIHNKVKQGISMDDLSDALDIKSDAITENENILKGIVKFGNIDAHTIMTPRMDVESVEINIKLPELLALINESGYSRIPVYDNVPDNVKGILYVKDLLPYIDETDEFRWQKLVRNAYFVPENKKIDDLLKEFQTMKMHMAVIIDEYGGMVGIVTLEDILEEIVGDIADESDDDEPGYVLLGENTFLFDGKVLLNDFYRMVHLDDTIFEDIDGADTLAGIILELKGEIPQKGDCVEYKNLLLCVESMDNRRIKQIKVTVNADKK